ncbi:MAG: hypothetical protein CMJ62_06265 [Planctomycetaceae bacterium]|nr:hypothetical protein [Planctomycetaceae bacterium]
MTEVTKTGIIVVVAVVLAGASIFNQSEPLENPSDDVIGSMMFEDFKDPLDAKSLEIVRHNEDLAEIDQFKVSEIAGVWSIPSHSNYPADAENQVRDAATILTDLEIMRIATDLASEHSLFGVVEPDPEKISAGDKGIGMLIAMQNSKGKDLARLVVGKQVKGADGQRFVRRPSQDRVYVVSLDPDRLSTKFEDWIETDLLDMNTWDIKQVMIKDYSVETALTLNGPVISSYDQRMGMQVSLENNSEWKLDELFEYRAEELRPTELLEDEELNTDRLNDMKNAFDDLEIVDVDRKPKGLGGDLRAEQDFMKDGDGLSSLFDKGFYPVDLDQTGQLDLLCSDGEVSVRTEDGVEYVLRFGRVAGLEDNTAESTDLNRYLFVMARLRDDMFSAVQETSDPESETSAAEAVADGDEKSTENTEEEREKDELQEKREKAEQKIKELNDRFADWYYIISEDVFKKIHLARADVIKTKDAAEAGLDMESLRGLQKGLEKENPAPELGNPELGNPELGNPELGNPEP